MKIYTLSYRSTDVSDGTVRVFTNKSKSLEEFKEEIKNTIDEFLLLIETELE